MQRLWIPHPELVWVPCWLHDIVGDVARFATPEGEAIELSSADLEGLTEVLADQVAGADDICSLEVVSEASLLHTIRARFSRRCVYTWVSRVLLAVNPFQALPIYSCEELDKYRRSQDVRSLPPHIFSVASDAVSSLRTNRRNQAIVINGESGAGKTESAKLIMSFITEAKNSPSLCDGCQELSSLQDKVLRTNPLLEAFGNAMTVRNNNSSRFVKWLNFHMSGDSLAGCEIQDYLLEATRICSASKGERSYHIFYQLLEARNSSDMQWLALEAPSCFAYCNRGELTAPGIDDQAGFDATREALVALGFDKAAQAELFRVVAAVLHLGNCSFTQSSARDEKLQLASETPCTNAAMHLGVEAEELKKRMLEKRIAVGGDIIVSPQRQGHAKASRDSIGRFLYSLLFSHLVERMNAMLQVPSSVGSSTTLEDLTLGILDIAGFECFEFNSLEQLLINLCNEHLQDFFNKSVFRSELEDYASEGLALEFRSTEFPSNEAVLQLLNGRRGLLDILDEEIALPKATDLSFASKVISGLGQSSCLVKPRFGGKATFGVCHFAGTVTYSCDGFLEKNEDKPPDGFSTLLASSELQLVRSLADRASAVTSKPAGRKPRSTCSKFRASLRSLLEKIDSAEVHFVRCVKPNREKIPGRFDSKMVLEQLRLSGVLEAVRIRQHGYPTRLLFQEFVKRYGFIHRCDSKSSSDAENANHVVQRMVKELHLTSADVRLGKTKVFMKAGAADLLETARSRAHFKLVTKVQSKYRGRIARARVLHAKESIQELLACLNSLGIEHPLRAVGERRSSQSSSVLSKLKSMDNAEQALKRLQGAAVPDLPIAGRLLQQAQVISARLTKELQVCKQLERLADSTDPIQIDKAVARAADLGLSDFVATEHLEGRAKALQIQLPLVQALHTTLDFDSHAALLEVVTEVEKEGLALSPDSWIPELGVEAVLRRAKDKQAEIMQAEKQKQAAPPQDQLTRGAVGCVSVEHKPEQCDIDNQQSRPSAIPKKRNSSFSARRLSALAGLNEELRVELLVKLERAGQEYDAVAVETLLHEARCHGLEENLEVYFTLLLNLQSETFLHDAIEQVLKEVDTECPPRGALKRLQNLSHQLRTLQGDKELVRTASRAFQQGTRRRASSGAAGDVSLRGSLTSSIFPVTGGEDFSLVREAFSDLRDFSKLKEVGTWSGHRNSQVTRLTTSQVVVSGTTDMLRHSKVTIAESLTRLPKTREAAAIQNFRNILIWMGDRPAQECQRIAGRESAVGIVRSDPLMRDEAYIQLLKQLTGNPSARSEWLGWQLLVQFCRAAPPSDELVDFVTCCCLEKVTSTEGQDEVDARAWQLAGLASECLKAIKAALPSKPAGEDTSGDLVGVVVYLIDGTSQNLFVPVATTLRELSTLLGSRIGVKNWKDFAFFQVTDKAEWPRLLPDMLAVSELVSVWEQLKEATGLTGHLHWRRRFLRSKEMLLASDPYHAALTFKQATLCHLHRPAPCQEGSAVEQLETAAALLCLDSDNPVQKIRENDVSVEQLLKGRSAGSEAHQELQMLVKRLQPLFGPRAPQLQRMSRALERMQRFPFFGAHHWPAQQIAHGLASVVVNDPPARALKLHGRQAEPEVWIFVDASGLHLVPASSSHRSGACIWSFFFQTDTASTRSIINSPRRSLSKLRRSSMHWVTSLFRQGEDQSPSHVVRELPRNTGRLLRWGACHDLLQLVVHTREPGRSVANQSMLVSLECSSALDAAFVVHCALCESLQLPTACA
eukprot:TRINITY_DN28706_c0_g1_i1.p1 TRINITY_DN28706_c0_g1~~TRINITY_DN28706_c0_g1_i1.p1  ORF type:complete len:1752 (+),score=268.07 TRINITY_DN28706_c0_g1_i1:97-5352(+)